jgi:hypothetical protein
MVRKFTGMSSFKMHQGWMNTEQSKETSIICKSKYFFISLIIRINASSIILFFTYWYLFTNNKISILKPPLWTTFFKWKGKIYLEIVFLWSILCHLLSHREIPDHRVCDQEYCSVRFPWREVLSTAKSHKEEGSLWQFECGD